MTAYLCGILRSLKMRKSGSYPQRITAFLLYWKIFYLISAINFCSFSTVLFRKKCNWWSYSHQRINKGGLSCIGKERSDVCLCVGTKPCLTKNAISVTDATLLLSFNALNLCSRDPVVVPIRPEGQWSNSAGMSTLRDMSASLSTS